MKNLGWQPNKSFDETLISVVKWTLSSQKWLENWTNYENKN